jgi:hypothetical protein
MAYLDGTRSATAQCDLSLSYNILVYPNDLFPFVAAKLGYVDGSIGGPGSHTGAYSTWTWSWTSTPHAPNWQWFIYLTMTSNDGYGHSTTVVKTVASGTESFATEWVDVAATLTGSWSCTVGTDKLWNIAETSYSISSAPTVFPPSTSYEWYELSRYGSTPSCTLTIGGTACTATGAYASGARHRMLYIFGASFAGVCQDEATASASITNYLVNGVTPYAASHTHSYLGQSTTNWSVSMTAGTLDNITVDLTSYARIAATCALNGRIRAWSTSYPDSLTCRITGFDYETTGYRDVSGTGSISSSDTFYQYSSVSDIVKNSSSDSKTTALDSVPISISCAITSASLTAVGEASTETRCMFRGFRFNGWSLAYNTTRSIAGTTNDRLFAPYEGMSGYRYLDIQIKAQSGTGVAGTFVLTDFHGNTKTWNITAATTSYQTVTIDLCSPDAWSVSALPLTDGKDNPYPRKNTASSSYAGSESVDSAYWGVTSCQRFRIATGAIDLGTTTLKQDTTNGFTNSHYVPSGLGYEHERITPAIVAEVDTTTYYYSRRFWQQKNDGRDEEESDYWWQKTVGGATGVTTYSVTPLSISDLAGQVNASDNSIVRHSGWTATNSVAYPGSGTCSVSQPPLRDCFLNGGTGISTWLFGGGILATPNATSGTDFAYGFEIGTGTITAQTLFDSINGDFIPDLYDPFDVNGGTDSALYLPFGTILRGPAHGIVFDNAGDPATTGTVTLQLSSDSSSRGTDSTFDALGNYQTGTPFGLGKANHSIVIGASSVGVNPMYSAKRQRAVFREETLAGNCTAADVSPAQQATYGVITASGGVKLYHSRAHNGTNWDEVTTPITNAECLSLAYQKHSGAMSLIIIVDTTSGEVKRYTTDDEGNTVSVATTIGTGAHGTVCVSPNGMEYIFFRTSSSNIQRVKRDPMGNVITAASNVVTGNVSDDEIACYWRLGVVYLIYTHTTNGITIVSSSDDAETFS